MVNYQVCPMHPSRVGFPVSESANKQHKKQSARSNLSPFWASLPKKWTGLDTYHSRQRFEIMEYIYIYLPRTWWSTSFLGRLTLHFMGQILQNVGPHLGSRYIIYTLHCFFVCFFFNKMMGFSRNSFKRKQTNSSSVPGPFLSNVSHVWDAQRSVKLRKQKLKVWRYWQMSQWSVQPAYVVHI